MLATFLLYVFYTQILIEVPGAPLESPFWTDDHVAQGFAWSPKSISFGLPDSDGQSKIIVRRSESFQPSEETLWAVQTPLDVPASPIRISSPTTEEHEVAVAPGRYNLVFEAQASHAPPEADIAYVIHLHLIPTETPAFAILKQGQLGSDRILRETTEMIPVPVQTP
ncbi:competence protein ComJ [Terrihabitans sp. B22-R8]|uniref:competence protein ComJ n=1 Tax=Terrihabitans sp. B22-R8 TaxID=3425128 RepID=UPI00403CDC69